MPRKSLHRKKLEAFLEQATDPAAILAVSEQLVKIGLQEERRSRQRRKKAANVAEADYAATLHPAIDPNATITI